MPAASWQRRRNRGAFTPSGPTGVLFAGDSQYARLAGAWTAGAQQMWWRGSLGARPQNNRTGYLFGNTGFGGPGFGFASEGYPGDSGAPCGRGYTWADANYRIPPTSYPSLVFPLDAIGKPFTVHAWRDSGGKLHVAIDGQEYGIPTAITLTDLGSTIGFGINTRASLDGTNPFGAQLVFEVGIASSVPVLADVRAHATALQGTQVPTMIEFFDGRDLGPNAARWTGKVAGNQLVLTGGVGQAVGSGAWGLGLGSWNWLGDSLVLGRSGPTGLLSTSGWRRPFFNACWGAGVSVSQFGATVNGSSVDDPRDYDGRHTAVGGKGLGVPSSGNSMRTDVATDMAAAIDPSGTRAFCAGANDLAYRVNTNLESAATAASNFLNDLGSYIGEMRSNGHTGRIVVLSPPRPSTAVSNPTQRSAHDLVAASWATTVDNARSIHGGEIRGYDLGGLWTPDFSGTGLSDGTHFLASRYGEIGSALATWAMGLAR